MDTESQPRSALVVVASTRCAAGQAEDQTGPKLVEWLRAKGYETPAPLVIADREVKSGIAQILDPLAAAEPAARPNVLLTTGGTGLTADDQSVEAVAPYLERELPGIVQAFFAQGQLSTPMAALSRAVAGTVGKCFVMTLPGSKGAVKDGMAVLDPILDHIVTMLEGGRDH